jgi:hypothetical protein
LDHAAAGVTVSAHDDGSISVVDDGLAMCRYVASAKHNGESKLRPAHDDRGSEQLFAHDCDSGDWPSHDCDDGCTVWPANPAHECGSAFPEAFDRDHCDSEVRIQLAAGNGRGSLFRWPLTADDKHCCSLTRLVPQYDEDDSSEPRDSSPSDDEANTLLLNITSKTSSSICESHSISVVVALLLVLSSVSDVIKLMLTV